MNTLHKSVLDVIKKGNNFLIASHRHPDGDGIGSTIALAKGIESLGKKTVMFNADSVPFNLKFLPYSDQIVGRLDKTTKFDATFMIDCSQRKRIGGDVADFPRENLGKLVLIDHHKTSSSECDIVCVDEDAAAAGEVVCRIFRDGNLKITPEIATLIFCTFVVDTGSFRYSNTTPALLREAAALVESGASPWAISMALDESNPPSYIKLLRLVLQTFEKTGAVASIVLTQQMFDEAGASVDVAEEFINFPRSIIGTEIAVLFRELPPADGKGAEKWKVSFRSKGSVDVQKIAVVFDGGGHSHAAGCTLDGSLASVKARVMEALKCTASL